MDRDKLRQELAELRSRIKPQAEWTSAQDRLDQQAIAQRIEHLRNYLDNQRKPNEGG
jgi:primosomal protein N''